jgi:hypothetical protein
MCALEVPQDDCLRAQAGCIEAAMASEKPAAVRRACTEFLFSAADFYRVPRPQVRVLAARPLRVREGGWATELFGDYHPEERLIRVWMRTAVLKQVTSVGTFLSTLCHEFCHHVDLECFGFKDSPHTRGFYARTAALYHYVRGTPAKRLCWLPMRGGRFRIDWPSTNRSLPAFGDVFRFWRVFCDFHGPSTSWVWYVLNMVRTGSRGNVLSPSLLEAALEGLEAQQRRLVEQIGEVRRMLGVHRGRPPKAVADSAPSVAEAPKKRRTMSASARRRIAAAQKKRWAEWRKRQK